MDTDLRLRIRLTQSQAEEILSAYEEERAANLWITARQLAAEMEPDDDYIPISEAQAAKLSKGKRTKLTIPWEVLAAYEDQIGNGIFDSIAGFFKAAPAAISNAARSAAQFGRRAVRTVADKVNTVLPARPTPTPRPGWNSWDPKDLKAFVPPPEPLEFARSREQFSRAKQDVANARSQFGVPSAWSTTQRFSQGNLGSSSADRNF